MRAPPARVRGCARRVRWVKNGEGTPSRSRGADSTVPNAAPVPSSPPVTWRKRAAEVASPPRTTGPRRATARLGPAWEAKRLAAGLVKTSAEKSAWLRSSPSVTRTAQAATPEGAVTPAWIAVAVKERTVTVGAGTAAPVELKQEGGTAGKRKR